jgi:hypothetical protein
MDTSTVTRSMNGLAARAYRARTIAIEMAGDARLVLPQSDGSALIVNYAGFDTSVWAQPQRRTRKAKARK